MVAVSGFPENIARDEKIDWVRAIIWDMAGDENISDLMGITDIEKDIWAENIFGPKCSINFDSKESADNFVVFFAKEIKDWELFLLLMAMMRHTSYIAT